MNQTNLTLTEMIDLLTDQEMIEAQNWLLKELDLEEYIKEKHEIN